MLLVIGCGNPLREDDGFGLHAIEALRAAGVRAELLHVQQLTPELAERIGHADAVVFVDARQGDEPGRLHCESVTPAAPGSAASQSLGPGALLAYAARLYGAPPPAVLLSVGGQRFGLGRELSPFVRAALPEVVRRVARWAVETHSLDPAPAVVAPAGGELATRRAH